uniref:Protein phosphatase 1, regulatory subunit 12C n=1 Tax=Paramormyrops kingsleyae TaxID=1676925 RepID=A0A3B3S6F2_9TELE
MADAAKSKRREQLKRWAGSMTDREPAVPRRRWRGDAWEAGEPKARQPTETEPAFANVGLFKPERNVRRVRFERTAEFLAACASGDADEASEMLRDTGGKKENPEEGSGGIVNSTNADGITALHQACIDGSTEMVVFLLEHGASINQADNEGWTPLHVAASCGNLEITDFLLQNGADVCKVNCDGDVPLDIAEDEDTEALLRQHTLQRGIDVATVKREEEEHLMRDARTWLSEGLPSDLRHPKTGATPLHVAAAKGYIEVIKLLCHCGMDVSLTDTDGWTAFHAAAHWGQGEACRILAEHLCNMEARSNAGQTPFDVADESMKVLLEELSQKQEHWRSEQSVNERQNVVEPAAANTSSKNRRSVLSLTSCSASVCINESRRALLSFPPTCQRCGFWDGSFPVYRFQTSTRDEESESQRKARSRLLRQSRRSTQGVTLTDLKEAEKSIGKSPDIPRSVQAVSPVVTVTPAERGESENYCYILPCKFLYRKVLKDNEVLREKLQETELQLNQNKVDLERLKQNQEQSSDRPALLELERYEKKALETKAMELEDELKILADLRADNQRLKDENAALIRVISKLSK